MIRMNSDQVNQKVEELLAESDFVPKKIIDSERGIFEILEEGLFRFILKYLDKKIDMFWVRVLSANYCGSDNSFSLVITPIYIKGKKCNRIRFSAYETFGFYDDNELLEGLEIMDFSYSVILVQPTFR